MELVIYNVTLTVTKLIHTEWLDWYKNEHIPNLMKTGCFVECKLYRVLYNDEIDYTYRIHCFCKSVEDYNTYESTFSSELRKEHSGRYPQIIVTRTVLEEIKI